MYCCKILKKSVEEDEIEYDSIIRFYSFRLKNTPYAAYRVIDYCPFCGTKLPEDLDGVWSKILREEFGINDPVVFDKDKIPEEFKTDKWWKKRGL